MSDTLDLDGIIIELVPEGLTQSTSLNKAKLLIFRDKKSGRHLPVLINSKEYDLIYNAFVKHDFSSLDLFHKLSEVFNIGICSVFISLGEKPGDISAIMGLDQFHEDCTKDFMGEINVNIAEGFVAALMMKAPIYITAMDFARLYNREMGDGRIAIPVASMPRDLLQEALNQAVEGENFELASVLRDEIKKRDEK